MFIRYDTSHHYLLISQQIKDCGARKKYLDMDEIYYYLFLYHVLLPMMLYLLTFPTLCFLGFLRFLCTQANFGG